MRRGFSVMICFALLFLTCSNPTTPPGRGNYLPPTSPENVLSNLEVAYNAKDLNGYLECLAADFSFYSPKVGTWGKTEEERIHRRMFQEVESVKLSLRLSSVTEDVDEQRWILYCAYQLVLIYSSTFAKEALGEVRFYLRREPNGLWKISDWREL